MWLVQLKGGWDFHLRQSADSQLVMKACNMYMTTSFR
jgi:hypothetical protein